MSNFCEDEMSLYDIRPSDEALLAAAKALGQKLASLPDCHEKQR
jgi:hypothetical protein